MTTQRIGTENRFTEALLEIKQSSLTLRLLLIRCDGADEVLWRHVHLGVPVLADDLQRGKVAEDLVGGRVGSDTVLVLHHLQRERCYEMAERFRKTNAKFL